MEEKQDLWELIRQKIEKNNEPETTSVPDEESVKLAEEEIIRKENKESRPQNQINKLNSSNKNLLIGKLNLLNQGVFAGFIYILSIMIVLGILMIPGSITAAIGGYFGGKKSGDPARALTAAMLPFLVIASVSMMGAMGALPPGSGPNDLSESIGEKIGYSPDDKLLGPISKMPDSNSSVFLSLVAFGFIGGLVELERKNKQLLD
ncbi:MAG: hypothetical protein VX022_01600 [Candidatus Thermoplasmatota archaeon]|nr:hypothetical protein [Candidatus Thermoplasmatota archaeon]